MQTLQITDPRALDERSDPSQRQNQAMLRLVQVVQDLSLARGLDAIVEIVRKAARALTGADGATFVLRDGEKCYYVDEDAISPLWKGQRFPLESCISGWAMLNRRSTTIRDIYQDARIPHAAYRPTFVKSLVMVPIRSSAPIGAIGNYWAQEHDVTADELALLEALANTTAVAIENVSVYQNLENQVRERTHELQLANQELEAFTSAVSHDLRAPLRAMNVELEKLAMNVQLEKLAMNHELEKLAQSAGPSVAKLQSQTSRMSSLIDDLLRLSRIGRAQLRRERLNLSRIAENVIARHRQNDASRTIATHVEPDMWATADAGLMNVVLENLISNAWKYSGKRTDARIDIVSELEQSGRRIYKVTDNGAGFDPSYAHQLFTPFARLHDAREFPGIGIGLATVQRVIQRHGGDIWAQSDGKSGATFGFTLD